MGSDPVGPAGRIRGAAGKVLPAPVKRALKRLLGREEEGGIAAELAFWECELSGKGNYPHTIRNCTTPGLRHLAFPKHFLPFFRQVKDESPGRMPRVLDVGSGPLSTLLWGQDDGLFDLQCVDLLASAYREMLERHGFSLSVELTEGRAERLVEIFDWQSFDACHANNSLDHTESPRLALLNMLALTRPGGLVMVGGNVKEGTNENWEGLHQHDLWLRGSELMHTDRSGSTRSLSGDLPLECLFTRLDADRPGAEMAIVWKSLVSIAASDPDTAETPAVRGED